MNDGTSLFAFQITVCWRSLICRQSCQSGIRPISMKSKEHMIPSASALLWDCCSLEPASLLLASHLFLVSAPALTRVAVMSYIKKWLRWELNTKKSLQSCTRNAERSGTELHHENKKRNLFFRRAKAALHFVFCRCAMQALLLLHKNKNPRNWSQISSSTLNGIFSVDLLTKQ